MTTSDALLRASDDLVNACRDHPFVRGIASGELARDRFVFYVEQDAWFLQAFARAYALAIAKAPDTATMDALRQLLDGVVDELRLHRGYAERWGADLEPEPAAATSAYTDFLLRVAWSAPVGPILAAMTPCMRLYAALGQALAPDTAADGPYREWVDTYASEAFEDLATTLEDLLDAQADAADPRVATNYRRAMALELAFFDQAADGR
ncbi:TenA family protein [Egicoccus halophilus]|uniref:Aminopyrimidine aminohydrolase n=1 Tax=Egicoccus halophilus TaxID=1670830 RepID=A0A8J3ACL2_9ACTN|nr:TenA family protein [Egicoccus halophilus]GGI08584.1 aminopyrimidine aminohydrolase [Egicoccus halophilus]